MTSGAQKVLGNLYCNNGVWSTFHMSVSSMVSKLVNETGSLTVSASAFSNYSTPAGGIILGTI